MAALQEFKCPNCDGGIEFSSGEQKMKCPYCDSEFEIESLMAYQAELDKQFACCDKIAAYWQGKGVTPIAYVETYGCQQNEADSEKLRGYLAQSGYRLGTEAEGADVVIMNTCAIREHAEQRVFGNLGDRKSVV